VILLLAVVYYNVGLGLRQRTMMLPTLLSMYVAMSAVLAQHKAVFGRGGTTSKKVLGRGMA
jgi:hypothetical protein